MRPFSNYFLAAALIILLIVTTLYVWMGDVRHRQELLGQYVESACLETAGFLEERVESTVAAIDRWMLPELQAAVCQTNRELLAVKAKMVFEILPSLRRMTLYDSAGRIEWMYPFCLNPEAFSAPHAEAQRIMRYAGNQRVVVFSPASGAQNPEFLSVYWPITRGVGVTACLRTDCNMAVIMKECLPAGAADFPLILRDGEKVVYRQGAWLPDMFDGNYPIVSRPALFGHIPLNLSMAPGAVMIAKASHLSNLPMLLFGLMIIAGAAVFMDQQMRRRLHEQKESQAVLRKLVTRLLDVQETERAQISGYLHDHVGQMLTLAKLDLETAADQSTQSKPVIEKAMTRVEGVLQIVRKLAASLRPPMLDNLGLNAALETMVREMGEEADIAMQFTGTGGMDGLSKKARECLYRVVQEALNNVVKHAAATRVDVSLVGAGQWVRLEVRDNGKGFNPDALRGEAGIGLLGMRHRLEQCGGQWSVESKPGEGTAIIVRVPVR